ncbi:MAG: type II toxin-antitoxin system Phd/YefM family antitoxin [Nitrospirae bacterium]|nr:MAG: type II toxin-antitoxin system Phd/YefM family antitoxin [Nitrospirota bacterium]
MAVTASKLRADIYRLLDQVVETGIPLEIERKGHLLRIVPVDGSPLDRLPRRPEYLRCDPEELVHQDWSSEWQP